MKDSDQFFGWQVNPNLNSPGERRVSNHHDEPPSPTLTLRHSVTYFVPIWIGTWSGKKRGLPHQTFDKDFKHSR